MRVHSEVLSNNFLTKEVLVKIMTKYEVVFCIVNEGYSEAVMDSAREVGARGGTVLHATGTANPQAESFFGISIEPNKEIVMIVVDSAIKENVLHNLYRDVGLKTDGQGIAFTLPVNDVVGLVSNEDKQKSETDAKEQHVANAETTDTESGAVEKKHESK